MLVTCPLCTTRYVLEDERLPPTGAAVQCTGCQHVFHVVPPAARAAHAPVPLRTGVRVTGNPLRPPPTRAWLVADRLTTAGWRVLPLSAPVLRLSRSLAVMGEQDAGPEWCRVTQVDGRWFAEVIGEGSPRVALVQGQGFVCLGGVFRFEESGALEVRAPPPGLTQHPFDEPGWRHWADALMEQGDPLGDWLMERRRSELELSDQLGALAPLVAMGLVHVAWNRFGFLTSMQLAAFTWARHPFCADPRRVPAAAFLQHLELTVAGRADGSPAWLACRYAPLPRSLQRIGLQRGAADEPVEDAFSLLHVVRQRCPHLQTTEATLFLPDVLPPLALRRES